MSKITKSARGEECDVRLLGICNGDPETTVYAHLPDGSGTGAMGSKSSDLCGVYACSSCHDEIDGRTDINVGDPEVLLDAHEGHMRTLRKLHDKGLIKIT